MVASIPPSKPAPRIATSYCSFIMFRIPYALMLKCLDLVETIISRRGGGDQVRLVPQGGSTGRGTRRGGCRAVRIELGTAARRSARFVNRLPKGSGLPLTA